MSNLKDKINASIKPMETITTKKNKTYFGAFDVIEKILFGWSSFTSFKIKLLIFWQGFSSLVSNDFLIIGLQFPEVLCQILYFFLYFSFIPGNKCPARLSPQI